MPTTATLRSGEGRSHDPSDREQASFNLRRSYAVPSYIDHLIRSSVEAIRSIRVAHRGVALHESPGGARRKVFPPTRQVTCPDVSISICQPEARGTPDSKCHVRRQAVLHNDLPLFTVLSSTPGTAAP